MEQDKKPKQIYEIVQRTENVYLKTVAISVHLIGDTKVYRTYQTQELIDGGSRKASLYPRSFRTDDDNDITVWLKCKDQVSCVPNLAILNEYFPGFIKLSDELIVNKDRIERVEIYELGKREIATIMWEDLKLLPQPDNACHACYEIDEHNHYCVWTGPVLEEHRIVKNK